MNKLSIHRNFGEVVVKMELPSVEKLFKSLSGGEITNVANVMEDRQWYFPRDVAPTMNFYNLDGDVIDEIAESCAWQAPNGTRYDFCTDTSAGFLLSGNRINVAFLRLQNIHKPTVLNFKGIFNDTTLETFSKGVEFFIKSLINFNKPMNLKFEIVDGDGSGIETIAL